MPIIEALQKIVRYLENELNITDNDCQQYILLDLLSRMFSDMSDNDIRHIAEEYWTSRAEQYQENNRVDPRC